MLTKEKRSKLIAGLLIVALISTVGCSSNHPKEKNDEEEESSYGHAPVYIPANSSRSTSSTPSTGITSSKPPASSAKVAAPASGKTGISTGAARSSAVS